MLQFMGSQRVGHDLATEQQISGRRVYRTKGCRVKRVQTSSFSQLYLKPIFTITQLMLNFVCLVLASLVAQKVKNPPAMQETWVGSLGWEDPLEKGMAAHFSVLAWRIPMDRGAWQATVHGVARVEHNLATKPLPHPLYKYYAFSSVQSLSRVRLFATP